MENACCCYINPFLPLRVLPCSDRERCPSPLSVQLLTSLRDMPYPSLRLDRSVNDRKEVSQGRRRWRRGDRQRQSILTAARSGEVIVIHAAFCANGLHVTRHDGANPHFSSFTDLSREGSLSMIVSTTSVFFPFSSIQDPGTRPLAFPCLRPLHLFVSHCMFQPTGIGYCVSA
jgi:hypothetical protein